MKLLGLLLVASCLLVAARVSAEPPALAREDRLALRVLLLERDVIVSRFEAVKAQADLAHAAKQWEIERFIEDLAAREGFDLSTWTLDPATGIWKERR